MKRTVTLMAWASLAMVAALAALNWPTMVASTSFNLLVTEVQLPLGLVILSMAALPLGLFLIAYLRLQISTLLETRRLLKEVQRAHDLADKAEASRVEGLQRLIATEFRALNDRFDSLGAALPVGDETAANPRPVARSLLAPWRAATRRSALPAA